MSATSYKLDNLFSVKRLTEHKKNKDGRPIASLSSFFARLSKKLDIGANVGTKSKPRRSFFE